MARRINEYTADLVASRPICLTAPRLDDGITGHLAVFGSFLRILSVSDHEDERGGHGRSAS
jgi:hypothetical protein